MELMFIIVREAGDLLKFHLQHLEFAPGGFIRTFGRRMAALEPANRLTGWMSKLREFMTTAIMALAEPLFIYVGSMLYSRYRNC